MQLPRYERKRIKRLADRFNIPMEAAKQVYLDAEGDTAAAREAIRILLIFNLLEGAEDMGVHYDHETDSEKIKRLELENKYLKRAADAWKERARQEEEKANDILKAAAAEGIRLQIK